MKIEDVYKREINDLIIRRGSTKFHITGIRHCDYKDKADDFIRKAAQRMQNVMLLPEEANQYDQASVVCRSGSKKIGYVSVYDLEKYQILTRKEDSDYLTGHFFFGNMGDHLLDLSVAGTITLDDIRDYRKEVDKQKKEQYGSWKHDAIKRFLVHSRHQDDAKACIIQMKEFTVGLFGGYGSTTLDELSPKLEQYKESSQYDISLEGQRDRWDILRYLDYLYDRWHMPGTIVDKYFEDILVDVSSQIGGELGRNVSYTAYIDRLTELVTTDLPSSEAAQHYLKMLPHKAFDDIRQQVENFPHQLYHLFHTDPREFVRTIYYARIPRKYLDPFLSGIALLEAYDGGRSKKNYLPPEDEYLGVVDFDWDNIPEDDKNHTIVFRKIPKLSTLHQELNDYLSRAEIILNRQINEKQQYEALGQLFDYIDKQSDDCLIYSTCQEKDETSFKWAADKGLILPYGENKLPGVLKKFLQRVRELTNNGEYITYFGGQLDIIDGWSWEPQDGVYPALEILTWLLYTIRTEMKNLHMIWKQLPPFEYIPKHKFRYRVPIRAGEYMEGGPDVEYHYMTDDDYDESESAEVESFGGESLSSERFIECNVKGINLSSSDNEVVNLSIDKAEVKKSEGRSKMGDGMGVPAIPEVLSTKVALRYWERLQKKGFVDEHFRLMEGVSRKQAMYIADLFAEHIGLTSRWKHFQELWQMKNLAQEKWDMQQTGNIPPRAKEIEEVFKD